MVFVKSCYQRQLTVFYILRVSGVSSPSKNSFLICHTDSMVISTCNLNNELMLGGFKLILKLLQLCWFQDSFDDRSA